MCLNLWLFLNCCMWDQLCFPCNVFPPDWFLCLEPLWSLPLSPLDAVCCALVMGQWVCVGCRVLITVNNSRFLILLGFFAYFWKFSPGGQKGAWWWSWIVLTKAPLRLKRASGRICLFLCLLKPPSSNPNLSLNHAAPLSDTVSAFCKTLSAVVKNLAGFPWAHVLFCYHTCLTGFLDEVFKELLWESLLQQHMPQQSR